MTTVQPTDRLQRFRHLLGIDRYRIVFAYPDGSTATESFDELTINGAKETAAAVLAPGQCIGARPAAIEVRLGQWVAVGSNDCEWSDLRTVAAGAVEAGAVTWHESTAPAPSPIDPTFGQQLELI